MIRVELWRCSRRREMRLLALVTAVLWCAPASAQQSPVPAAQTSPAKPPVFNRANDVMPSWLRVRGEFRERFEGFTGSGFVDGRDDAYWLSRFRFGATVTPSNFVALQVQG